MAALTAQRHQRDAAGNFYEADHLDGDTDMYAVVKELVLIMRKEAEGKGQVMPEKAMVPAAMTLLLKLLDYIDRSKIAPIGAPELDRATHVFVDFILARLGITKQMLADAAQRVHRLTQDPQAMHAISLKAGTLVHPLAAKPTEVGLINGPA